MRFWIHAFACKSSDHAAQTASKLIAACSNARKQFTEAKTAAGPQVRMGPDPNESGAAYLLGEDIDFSVLGDQSMAGSDTSMGPIDLSLCLKQAQASVEMNEGNDAASEAGSRAGLTDLDLDLSTSVLEEMYDLDMALHDYDIPAELRGKLLDAWQRGFSTLPADSAEASSVNPLTGATRTATVWA